MSLDKLPPYVVQELPDVSDVVNEPLKFGVRIKYTCFDVSKSYIVFGATSGGAYMFNRSPCEFIQLIPSKDGPATIISISPDEKYVAIANKHGIVTVTHCHQSPPGHQNTLTSKEHSNFEISALVWGNTLLFMGDDVGNVSVLQVSSFITKAIFQSTSQTIMNLDSRICQLDVRDCMLLISTLTRCYICDTSKQLYRLIGQKLREGKFGACFVTSKTIENGQTNDIQIKELKKYNIVSDEHNFFVNENFSNTMIYCARPSSRIWEATMDGSVKRTHQYRVILAKTPYKVISKESYDNDDINIHSNINIVNKGQSCIFAKIFSLKGAILSFSNNAVYFLNIDNVENTIWIDNYKDIIDCKVLNDTVYLWLQNSSIVTLKYTNIEKYLIQSYLDGKYTICAKFIEAYTDYLLSDDCYSNNLHILVGLRDKLKSTDVYAKINKVIDKLDERKVLETPTKHGIIVVDNSYHTQSVLNETLASDSRRSSPETLTLKDIGNSVTDKFNNSTKILKDKIVDFGGKVKNLSQDKDSDDDKDIIKESSQEAITNNSDIKELHNVNNCTSNDIESELLEILESNSRSDMEIIFEFLRTKEPVSKNVKTFDVQYTSNNAFLSYINNCKNKDKILDVIITNETYYSFFVDSCIKVNLKNGKLSNLGCDCGFPLPYSRLNKVPEFAGLLDLFIEKQWSSPNLDQLYETCKRMPYAWRKILYLRRNEDLMNILRLLLQILDERLLHSFLPQFTIQSWEYAVKLYATLHGNLCLNCNKRFDSVIVKERLSWDDFCRLMIKSIGGKDGVGVLERNAEVIGMGEVSMRFYLACMLAEMFSKIDSSTIEQLTDTVYEVFEFEDARNALNNLLRTSIDGTIKNTSLPIIVAANTTHWGLKPLYNTTRDYQQILYFIQNTMKKISLEEILVNLQVISKDVECSLCGLPLVNKVLIRDAGLWVFRCGHVFHGACLEVNLIKLCPSC